MRSGSLLWVLLLWYSCSSKSEHPKGTATNELRVDTYEVTVGDFKKFTDETGYQTTADSLGWSGFWDPTQRQWTVLEGANWSLQDGHSIQEDSYPAVHMSYYDACAYCHWKKGRLPTAEEWDRIAGDTVLVGNVWQGLFPHIDQGVDGYTMRTAPVGQFTANAGGLYDLFGNVWEWTSSIDETKNQRIIKGGSFLCDYKVCQGYIPSRYQTTPDDSGLNHLGFRCVYDNKR
ncbi:MAG: SUMF1/EgtB/PvdO family nonheme iron enzyme [Bacteroidota bacterium]